MHVYLNYMIMERINNTEQTRMMSVTKVIRCWITYTEWTLDSYLSPAVWRNSRYWSSPCAKLHTCAKHRSLYDANYNFNIYCIATWNAASIKGDLFLQNNYKFNNISWCRDISYDVWYSQFNAQWVHILLLQWVSKWIQRRISVISQRVGLILEENPNWCRSYMFTP